MNILFRLIFGVALLWPGLVKATVNLPFSTTYNCVEASQTGTFSLWQSSNICDGMRKHGDWLTQNGSGEQVTSAANFPGGGGGRGQRHWIGNEATGGDFDGSGGMDVPFSTRVNELYIRFYTRWETGLKIGGQNPNLFSPRQKLIYTFFDCGPPSSGGCGVWDIERDTFSLTLSGTSYTQGNWGWNQLFGGASGSDTASDGSWHCIEFHMKNETVNTANDGIARVFVDGVLRFNVTNVDYKGSTGWTGFGMPDNHQFRTVGGEAVDMFQDFDDLVVQTTGPIGCIGGDTTAPTITITSPTSGATFNNSTVSRINLAGTASDNVGVTSVTWSNDRGGSGTASGTTSWSINSIALSTGVNNITVTARDAANNTSVDTIAVTYTAGPPIILPFYSTYDCAEAVQPATGQLWNSNWPNCDAIRGYGQWETANGGVERITSAANYPGGGGGRGQRHLFSNSDSVSPSGSGQTFIGWGGPVQEIFVRWYARWEAGSMLGGTQCGTVPVGPSCLPEHKILYFSGGNCGQPGGCHIDIKQTEFRIVISGFSFGGGSWGWNQLFNGTGNNVQSDGSWHCLEMRLKNETSPGANNGIFTFWVDGVQRAHSTAVDTNNSIGFEGFAFPDNHQLRTPNPNTDAFYDMDDLALSTTGPIGCFSGTSDTTPPTITISTPTANPTHDNGADSTLDLAGTASDNIALSSVTWSNNRGGSGAATGTASWSVVNIPLQIGTNVVTVTATDTSNNIATDVITVTHQIGSGNVLLQESFDDANIASRGWYDGAAVAISTVEKFAGAAAMEWQWATGNSTPTGVLTSRHSFTATETLYVRFYQKHSTNWVGHGVDFGHHELYLLTDQDSAFSNLAFTRLTTYIEKNGGVLPTTGSVAELATQDGANIDQNQIGVNLIGVTENRATAGCNGDWNDGYSTISCYQGNPPTWWNGKQWKTGTQLFSDTPGPFYKGDWHKIEVYFQMNSIVGGIGQANGIMRYWFDGQLVKEHTNVMYRTGARPTQKWNQIIIGPFMGNGSPVTQTVWTDELLLMDQVPGAAPQPVSVTRRRVQ